MWMSSWRGRRCALPGAMAVLRSCEGLLPLAEATFPMAARRGWWVAELTVLSPASFGSVAAALSVGARWPAGQHDGGKASTARWPRQPGGVRPVSGVWLAGAPLPGLQCDAAVAVLVEEGEGLVELEDVFEAQRRGGSRAAGCQRTTSTPLTTPLS
jgi:hypothetical protein